MEKAYRNLALFASLLFVITILGFYKTYFALFPAFDASTTKLVHIHLMLLLSWIVLLIVQPFLIRKRKYKAHRIVGKASYFLVPLIVLSMIGMVHKQFMEDVQQRMSLPENLKAIFIGIAQLILFVWFYIFSIIHKKNIAYHMRYMIGTGLVMITPAFARLCYEITNANLLSGIASFVLTDFIIAWLVISDKRKKRKYKPYISMLIAFILYQSLFLIFQIT